MTAVLTEIAAVHVVESMCLSQQPYTPSLPVALAKKLPNKYPIASQSFSQECLPVSLVVLKYTS